MAEPKVFWNFLVVDSEDVQDPKTGKDDPDLDLEIEDVTEPDPETKVDVQDPVEFFCEECAKLKSTLNFLNLS